MGGRFESNKHLKWNDGSNITFKVGNYGLHVMFFAINSRQRVNMCVCLLFWRKSNRDGYKVSDTRRKLRRRHYVSVCRYVFNDFSFVSVKFELWTFDLQWRVSSTPMQPTGLFWTSDHCSKFGGYVCKRKNPDNLELNFENQTIISTESVGTLTSPSKSKTTSRKTITIDSIVYSIFAIHIQIIQIYIRPIQITM